MCSQKPGAENAYKTLPRYRQVGLEHGVQKRTLDTIFLPEKSYPNESFKLVKKYEFIWRSMDHAPSKTVPIFNPYIRSMHCTNSLVRLCSRSYSVFGKYISTRIHKMTKHNLDSKCTNYNKLRFATNRNEYESQN